MREALWYEKLEKQRVLCVLCPHRCRLKPGAPGICRVRYNKEGVLYTRNYGQSSPPALDPMEKKPLYHFHPGSLILSVGTFGCNFQCSFCQNWHLAHEDPVLYQISPTELAELTLSYQQNNSIGLSYTYSEPTIWFEQVLETAQIIHQQGMKNVLVTNGFIEQEPLAELLPYMDAFNIDIKGFNLDFYRKIIKGDYRPVLETAKTAFQAGKHVEITTLLIPGLNDDEKEIQALVAWIAEELGPQVPFHISRYSPAYKLDLPPTPLDTLIKAQEIAQEKLHYVYLGNAPRLQASNTFCPQCGELVIERTGYGIRVLGLAGSSCAFCGRDLNMVR